MVLEPVKCPICGGINVGKHGKTINGKQRFICKESDCEEKTFIRDYSEKGRLPKTKEKKEPEWQSVNQAFLDRYSPEQIVVDIVKTDENHEVDEQETAVERDEMWRYVGSKTN